MFGAGWLKLSLLGNFNSGLLNGQLLVAEYRSLCFPGNCNSGLLNHQLLVAGFLFWELRGNFNFRWLNFQWLVCALCLLASLRETGLIFIHFLLSTFKF